MGAIEKLKATFRRQGVAAERHEAKSGGHDSKRHEGERMTTTATVEKDPKVEKRRALGRGLDSLLPGPRVVPSGAPTGAAAGKQQVPPPGFASGRNDIAGGTEGAASLATDSGGDAGTRTEPALSLPKGV